jgi:DNA-binding CsgD family transcriptional regulator
MSDRLTGLLDPTRILFDLQQGNEIAQSISGCLEPEEIAHRLTEGLVSKFNCAFARIWLLESDKTTLRLVSSSGMYTRLDGTFAKIPMGAYKVGKIAQNRVSFLSNNLASESWVGNREWAIANKIKGFAGYPLAIGDRVIGVLATFSHHQMEPEFLEILQTLCTIATVALDTAQQYQNQKQIWQSSTPNPTFNNLSLSDRIASILNPARLTLVGTEKFLSFSIEHLFLKAAEILKQFARSYYRLTYTENFVSLGTIVPIDPFLDPVSKSWLDDLRGELSFVASCWGGVLETQDFASSGNDKQRTILSSDRELKITRDRRAIQILLKIPYLDPLSWQRVRIHCRFPILQTAFAHLSFLAGLSICHDADRDIPLLTDDIDRIPSAERILWIQQGNESLPKGIKAKIDLSITPEDLRQALEAIKQGETWGLEEDTDPPLSERELEIITLLTQGLRDRDIAHHLIISESTVKFHLNNVLAKLKVKTRYQAIHRVMAKRWI